MLKTGDKKVSELSKELGISEQVIYRWYKKDGPKSKEEEKVSEQEKELRELRARLADVTEERDILKKAKHLLKTRDLEVDEFLKENQKEHGIEKMCKVLEVSRSNYYKRVNRDKSKRAKENKGLLEKIREVFRESKERYGSPRITAELKRSGISCNKKRIARLMSKYGIAAKMFRKYRNTTNSNHDKEKSENILGGEFNRQRANEVWTGDITYISTEEGWLYLAAVIDIYSRKVIGWQLDKHMGSDLAEKALKNALLDRRVEEGIIFHSDQGIQYASESFRKILKDNGFIQSMSRKGNCYDNAITETFFHTLKTELMQRTKYKTREEARKSIFEYIEIFYNRKRLHSAIGYRPPVEYEGLTKLT
ncbi:MAG: IS3 family transposase [Ignavibacteria bacterium]|nr:IS3 family transposase [Ignavibacteria bacterium]